MSKVIYDLGDLGPFQDVVGFRVAENETLGWFQEVVLPWTNQSTNYLAFEGNWSDSFVYEKRSGTPMISNDVGFFSLPLRPELVVFNGLHASRITESFDGVTHRSVQETVTVDSVESFQMRVQVLTHTLQGDFAFDVFPVVYFPRVFIPVCAFNVLYETRYTLDLIATHYRTQPPINYPVNPITGETIYAIGVEALSLGARAEGARIAIDFNSTCARYPIALLPAWCQG